MHWSPLLLAAYVFGVAAAHGDHALPKLLGGRKLLNEFRLARHHGPSGGSNRRSSGGSADSSGDNPRSTGAEEDEQSGRVLRPRQRGGTDGQCGTGYGSCARGYCCSPEGWCGLTDDYCSAPDCQLNYGSGCDGNQKPSGDDTSQVPRPKVGSVPYGGVGIYDCIRTGDIAVTFDDGPYNYTGDLLDKLASYGAKATFFITGNNLGKGMINDYSKPWAGYIRRMINEGHQVASHTWSHQNASQLTAAQFRNQMLYNEIAFNDILGFFPTYMRPPFSICEKNCKSILSTLGYHIVYFDLDTQGYLNDDPNLIQNSKDIWDDTVDPSNPATQNFLLIEHDIHYQTVYNLTDYILTGLFAKGYRSVTVGECLGDPPANWYRAGSGDLPGAGRGGGGGGGGGGATSAPTSSVVATKSPPPPPPPPSSSASTQPARPSTTRTVTRTTRVTTTRLPSTTILPSWVIPGQPITNAPHPAGTGGAGNSPAVTAAVAAAAAAAAEPRGSGPDSDPAAPPPPPPPPPARASTSAPRASAASAPTAVAAAAAALVPTQTSPARASAAARVARRRLGGAGPGQPREPRREPRRPRPQRLRGRARTARAGAA